MPDIKSFYDQVVVGITSMRRIRNCKDSRQYFRRKTTLGPVRSRVSLTKSTAYKDKSLQFVMACVVMDFDTQNLR